MNKKMALGRGLSALLPEDKPDLNEELREVDIDLIVPNKEQPRTRFDDGKLDELTQSIKENGIIQPIILRRMDNNRFEIIAGERRWRAAQKANLKKVPAVIKEVSDDKRLELALIENIQRHELNSMEEARAYQKLIKTFGLTQEMVANRVGKDRVFVANYLRMLRLPEDIQKLVEDEKITVGHARALLGIEDHTIQRRVVRSIMEMALSVRETERLIKRIAAGESIEKTVSKERKSKAIDANIRAAEEKLRRRFGTKVKIAPDGRGTGGKIEFEYYSEADMDRIFQLLMLTEKAN
ncbi:MAG: ParB/RepB/Spo0J family partition protein [Acidobacteriota bacterium]|nr:ParB/RepB/Spo0J family partition protein [Acidobacteriota bacterium]